MSESKNRKDEHIKYSHAQFSSQSTAFDDCQVVHNSIGKVNFKDIDLSIELWGRKFPAPFYINAMTGGSKKSLEVNRKLAQLAKSSGLMMATGSISSAIRNPELAPSFTIVREENPYGFVLANVGAEQSLENAKRAIDLIQADALQIHLNVPEEMIMPEGDNEFKFYKDNLFHLVQNLDIPIVVKEVGFGMSRETIDELIKLGVENIDISGSGGTNFIKVENERRSEKEFNYLENFGQSTLISLLEAQDFIDQANIIASGGIKNPYDVVKCLSLGAKACGMSAYYLNQVLNFDIELAIENIQKFNQELKTLMTIFNAKKISELRNLDLVISGYSRDWCQARGIDYSKLARRKLQL